MPAPVDEQIKRKVIQQWISGDSRAKIATDNNIGEGTVSSIVIDFKVGLDNSEFDSARELAVMARKQGLNLSELASNFRLHNFIRSSGAAEETYNHSLQELLVKVTFPPKISFNVLINCSIFPTQNQSHLIKYQAMLIKN
jgi:hypothetical protein